MIVVIPAYEPPENFIDYVREVVNSAKAVVIVAGYLLKGESLIVYPDIEYTAGSDKISEIYDGFLYVTEPFASKRASPCV